MYASFPEKSHQLKPLLRMHSLTNLLFPVRMTQGFDLWAALSSCISSRNEMNPERVLFHY